MSGETIFKILFDKAFPYHVRLNDEADWDECWAWLNARTSDQADYTWRAQREVAFMDPKIAMEFKLIFG